MTPAFSRKQLVRTIAVLIFLFCMLFANFYAVRAMNRYGVEIFFYDKLLVAYDIGGMQGLKKEFKDILSHEHFRRELILAKEFEEKLNSIKDPKAFLEGVVSEIKEKALRIKNFRIIAIILMIIIFTWRIIANRRQRLKG